MARSEAGTGPPRPGPASTGRATAGDDAARDGVGEGDGLGAEPKPELNAGRGDDAGPDCEHADSPPPNAIRVRNPRRRTALSSIISGRRYNALSSENTPTEGH